MKKSLHFSASMLAVAAAAIILASTANVGAHFDGAWGNTKVTDVDGFKFDGSGRKFSTEAKNQICPDGTTNCTNPNGPDVTGLRDGLQARACANNSLQVPKCLDRNTGDAPLEREGERDVTASPEPKNQICPDGTTDCTNPNGPDVTGLRDGLQASVCANNSLQVPKCLDRNADDAAKDQDLGNP